MKHLLLILNLIILISSTKAQKPLTNSRQGSYYTYIYRLDDETVKRFYSKKMMPNEIVDAAVDSFLTDKPRPLHLQPGNYLEVSTLKNKLQYKLLQRRSAYLKILENRHDLQFVLSSINGEKVEDAQVYLGGHKIPFDPKRQLYHSPNFRNNQLLQIKHQGISNFYTLTSKKEHRYSYQKPGVLKRLWQSIKRRIRRHPESRSYYYAPQTNPGFLVFNKPVYRPGDTVKLKAFILDKKSKKPIRDPKLLVRLKDDLWDNGKIIGYVNAYRPGGFEYEFKLTDSLDLDLDDDYTVSLETLESAKYDLDEYDGDLEDREYLMKRTIFHASNFHYEDYELKTNRFAMRADKTGHSPGSPISLYLKATDENDLNVADGRIELTLISRNSRNYKENTVFIPDTLWQHQMQLDATGETKLVIPDSIFPKADLDFTADAVFLNANNERLNDLKYLSFKSESKEIDAKLDGDTLKINYRIGGKEIRTTAMLAICNANNDTLLIKKIQLPARELLGQGADVYSVSVDSYTKAFSVRSFPAELSASGYRNADSLFIKVSNPRKLNFWYTIFSGKKIVLQGKTNSLDYAHPFKEKKNVSVLLNFLWGGEPAQQEIQIPYQDKLLSIQTSQPLTVYPGQQVNIEVDVKDAAGKPVAGADITGYSFTRKFQNATVPFIPYLGRVYPYRTLSNPVTIGKLQESGELKLNWQRWSKEMGLDSIEYYKFTHPSAIYRIGEPAPDSITQIAPFVVKDGDILPVHILYIDEKPVYFSQTTHLQRYSFRVEPGSHKVRFRTKNMMITLDSVIVTKGEKLILSLNGDMQNNTSAKFVKQAKVLSSYEATLINKYLISVVNNFGDRFATIEQSNSIFLLNTESSDNYGIRPHSDAVLTGPYNGLAVRFTRKDSQPVYFNPEPGYSFEFQPGLLKQKSLDEKYPFSLYLDNNISNGNDYMQYALTGGEVDTLWQYYLDLRSHTTCLFRNEYLSGRGTGRLIIKVDTLNTGKVPFVKNIIVYKKGDPDFMKIFPGNTTDLQNYSPGIYRVFYLLKGNKYILQDNVRIRANGTNYYSTGKPDILPADTVSFNIAKVIENKSRLNGSNQEDESSQLIKEIFNEKYLDTGTFTGLMSGAVYDKKDKTPIPGVTVKVKGTSAGTTTDMSGRFSIKVPSSGKLQIMLIGYETKEVSIQNGGTADVYLSESHLSLDEVVVVGYGAQKKTAVTGAVSVMYDRLEGVQIRGVSSSASGSPLIIVDGVPYAGNIESLDPTLIGEMNTLKNEAATALYGSRGANGVILISTKKKAGIAGAGEAQAEQQQSFRRNFADYAFWQPRLRTDEQGKASFTVTFPDDITNWRTFFIGMSGNKQSGYAEGQIKSYKSINASFTSPLFAVRGDTFEPVGKIMNYTTDTISLNRGFSFNGKLMKEDTFRITNSKIDTFRIQAEGKDSLHFEYSIKRPTGYFDGERRSIPLYERGVLETKGIFETLEKDTSISLSFDPKLGKVTLRAEASLLPVLLEETNRLRKYEYLCNEQIASKLKGLLAEKKIRAYLKEPFKHEKDINELIEKLLESRRKEGTWGWWKDTSEELWISLHAAEALLEADAMGFRTQINKQKLIDYLIYEVNVLKGQNKLTAIELLSTLNAKADFKSLIKDYERSLSPKQKITEYEKMKLMRTRQRAGLPVSTDSLLKTIRYTMFGNAYWGGQRYLFFDNSIQLSILAYRILREDGKHTALLSKIRNYFLEQRKDGQWRNTYESSLILETILPDILKDGKTPEPASLILSGERNETVTRFPYTAMLDNNAKLTIEKKGEFPVYLTAYQQFFNSSPAKTNKDFTVNTSFEKDENKLNELKGGQPVVLKADVIARADADYVMIEIPIPAGCSYESKEQSYSYTGSEVHREYFKNKVSIFCNKLKAGRYSYSIKLVPRYTGTYTLNPAKVEMMYFPVFFGREEIKQIRIK
ncbi:carboxypeptidase-like regulatory domain-containing protein [Arcticibacter tournemirensis]|uniref:Alpha-2-macroglobulin domain-containing protein n=1 Tax=Arcticibacter tournemirensis TaxID=699437 RepID=A0A4Q0M3Y3_9SPHI|nr:carboxypeptidase-like regulatory domain-containing protein [Arcticibacter tournemirensis]RXF67640.1 hypothetical protein EKH83_18830 [Arcticibacter tournemirensis]